MSVQSQARLAPITLVYGPNSAGKSTLLQALLVTAQSLLNGNLDLDPLQARGPLVDIGGFESLLSHHDLRRPLRLGLDVVLDARRGGTISAGLDLTYRWSRLTNAVELRDVAIQVGNSETFTVVRRDPTLRREIDEARRRPSYFAFADHEQVVAFLRAGAALAALPERGKSAHSDTAEAWRSSDSPPMFEPTGLLPGRLHLSDFASHESGHDQDLGEIVRAWNRYASSLARELDNVLQRVAYLGPVRQPPQRLHVLSGLRHRNVGSRGEHAVEALARDAELVARVNRALERLEVPYDLSLERLGGDATSTIGEVVALTLTDARSGVRVSPADVGFGLSQLLPVIVESFLRGPSIVAIEQPEIHLHPRLQADLADVLIEAAMVNSTQFVIETHSENMLLRIQRRIREGSLSAAMVSVLYVDRSSDRDDARLIELRMNESGSFMDEWPSGFFEERFEELFPEF